MFQLTVSLIMLLKTLPVQPQLLNCKATPPFSGICPSSTMIPGTNTYLFSTVSVTSGHKCSDFKQHTHIGLQFQSVRQSSWAKVKASVLPGCSMTQSHLTFKSLEATCVLCSLPLLVKLAVTPLISHVTHASGSSASLIHLKRIFFCYCIWPTPII